MWRCGVAVITTAQVHLTKPELRFCAGSNPTRSISEIRDGKDLWQWFCAGSNSTRNISEIRDGKDLWQWSWLEIGLSAFRRSTIPQKQFIIIINQVNVIFINVIFWIIFELDIVFKKVLVVMVNLLLSTSFVQKPFPQESMGSVLLSSWSMKAAPLCSVICLLPSL